LQYTWVSSTGGPLLVAPQSVLSLWTGADSPDGNVEGWGEYGRACAIDGYIGVITIGQRQALTPTLPGAISRLPPNQAAVDLGERSSTPRHSPFDSARDQSFWHGYGTTN
jgi:Immunity protein 21